MAGEMKLRISVDDKGSVAINNVRQQVNKLAKDSASASAAMSSFKTAMGGLISVAAVMGLVRLAKGSLDAMDRIDELSQQTGIATGALQAYGYAAKFSGVSMEDMAKSMGRLSRNVYDAAGGLGESKRAFETLGISVKTAEGTLRTTEDIMVDVAERFAKMEDGTAKTALALTLFGRAGANMIPFLNMGKEGIAKLTAEAERLGIVLDEKAIKQAAELTDNIDRMKASFSAAGATALASIVPSLNKLAEALLDTAAEGKLVAQWGESVGMGMKVAASSVLVLAQAFDILGTSVGEALARGQRAYEKSSWLSKLTGIASIKAGVAGFAGGLNDPNSMLTQKAASYAKIWDSLWNPQAGAGATPPRAIGGGASPDDKGAEARGKQIASITESWASKMLDLGTDMTSLYQDDLTKAIIDIEAKAAAMYSEADKAALTHGVTLDTSVIGKWKEAMIANAEYQAEMKNTETILASMAATAEKQAAAEGARMEGASARAIAEAAAQGELKKGYIDLAVTMGQLSETDAIEAKYTIEKAILELEWERIAVLSEIAAGEEDLVKITERAYALKLKGSQLEGQKNLDMANAGAVKQADQFGEDIAGALNNALTELFFNPAKFSWENFWNDLRRIAAKAMSDMVTDWIKAQMQMTSGGSSSGSGCFGNFFSSLFGGGGGSSMWSGIELPAYGYHTGGIVGSEGSGRSVSPALFATAPRFHGGLFPGEFPAVLKRGEGVFTQGQMRSMGGTYNTYNISAMDAQSFDRVMMKHKRSVASATMAASRSNHPIRRSR